MAIDLKFAPLLSALVLQFALPLTTVSAQYPANYRGFSGSYTSNYFPGGFSNTIPGSAANEPVYYPAAGAPVVAQPPAAYVQPALPAPTYVPAPTYAPAPQVYPTGGCNSCQSQVYNYRPPAYRTTTMRVPVTVYRPVTALDPNYGTPVTTYQACTAYRVQPRRVAGWDFPILSWLFGRRQPVYTQPPVVANYGACSVQPYSGADAYYDNGYATTLPSTSTVITQPQSTWQPAAPAPAAPAPYTPTSPMSPQYIPQGPAPTGSIYQPQGSSSPAGSSVPADRQPRLRPNYDEQNGGETEESETELNGANGSSLYQAPIRRPYYPQPAVPVASDPYNPSAAPGESASRPRLRLVPDPDATNPGTFKAPQLIDPRDRSAGYAPPARAWGVVAASWPIAPAPVQPAHTRHVAAPAVQGPAAQPSADEIKWDDSGWGPARKAW